MSFGRNPHVAKAEAAELKAQTAKDDLAREAAWRDAARQWDRAAERETEDERRQHYAAKAEAARNAADEPAGGEGASGVATSKAKELLN
jgi:hypothetical protein